MANNSDKIESVVNVQINSSFSEPEIIEHYNTAFYVFVTNTYVADGNQCNAESGLGLDFEDCRVVQNFVDGQSKSIYEWMIEEFLNCLPRTKTFNF